MFLVITNPSRKIHSDEDKGAWELGGRNCWLALNSEFYQI